MPVKDILLYVALAAGFIPVALMLFIKKPSAAVLKAIAPYAWLTLLGTVYEIVVTMLLRVDHDWWWRIYSLLDFTLFSYFFYRVLPVRYAMAVRVLVAAFFVLFITITVCWGVGLETESYLTVPQAGIAFTYVFLWFRDLFGRANEEAVWNLPEFYYVVGLTLYMAATLFLFILIPVIWENRIMIFSDVWTLNVVAVLFFRLMLSVSIWKAVRK